ncbi:MAG: ABC transporter ATP-binding protein [Firmicutes bacterium]|nr:ABC transporter ATP-binding protein [Bacillota bacterium]
MIRLTGVSKTYDTGKIQVQALKPLDLVIEQGEYVAIMGSSGSGKSTLMNILGCLDRPTSGQYLLDGQDVSDKSDNELSLIRNQKIGFVFQSFNLIPRTSALKNVELPMIYARVSSKQREARARELLEKVGLGERLDHMPNEISGGQKQRVAIARALANRPPIIFADEPTGNLDSASSVEIMEIFTRLNREEGTTVVLVTHEPDIAEFADRILTFRDGRVISDVKKKGQTKGEVTA